MRSLLIFGLLCASGHAVAQSDKPQAPTETTEDPNKQQIVPPLGDIPAPAKGYGTIVGQFVFDGDIPEKLLLHKKGDAKVKDAATCATKTHYRNDLVINEKSKGIRNIFIYEKKGAYKKKMDAIHPDLRKPKSKFLWFDQEGCRFFPKALLVRAGQEVIVLSNDDANHNLRSSPMRNQPVNMLIGPKDRKGNPVPMTQPETAPTEVACDLHPWMRANWLIMDHPYMAVSNNDGRFMIANLPKGKHEFRLWHRLPGYLHKKIGSASTPEYKVVKGKMFIEVPDGKVLDLKQIKLKPEWFPEDAK